MPLLREISPEELKDIGKLFSTPLGKKSLEVLNRAFYDTVSFDSTNTHMTAFKEGQRDIVHIFREAAKSVKGDER